MCVQVNLTDFVHKLTDVLIRVSPHDIEIRIKQDNKDITLINSQWFNQIRSAVCELHEQNRMKVRCYITFKRKQISILTHFFYCTYD